MENNQAVLNNQARIDHNAKVEVRYFELKKMLGRISEQEAEETDERILEHLEDKADAAYAEMAYIRQNLIAVLYPYLVEKDPTVTVDGLQDLLIIKEDKMVHEAFDQINKYTDKAVTGGDQ